MEREFETISGLAQRLGISERTIYRRLRESPEVAVLNDGRIKRFRVEDYIRVCNRRKRI